MLVFDVVLVAVLLVALIIGVQRGCWRASAC